MDTRQADLLVGWKDVRYGSDKAEVHAGIQDRGRSSRDRYGQDGGRRSHLQVIVDRLNPYADAIGTLVEQIESTEESSPGVGGVLGVVRHFDDDEGEDEDLSIARQPGDPLLGKLPGQHQLLGWRLAPSVISFLLATRSALDIDEYG